MPECSGLGEHVTEDLRMLQSAIAGHQVSEADAPDRHVLRADADTVAGACPGYEFGGYEVGEGNRAEQISEAGALGMDKKGNGRRRLAASNQVVKDGRGRDETLIVFSVKEDQQAAGCC